MSTVFYKKGNTHKVRGIDCELLVIKPQFCNGTPPEGYYFSPEKAYGLQEEEKSEEAKQKEISDNLKIHEQKAKEERIKLVLYDVDIDSLDNKELRITSRKCGIVNWDDARFKTLRMELAKCQQAI